MRKLLNIWTLIVTAVLLMGAGTTYYSIKSTDSITLGGLTLGTDLAVTEGGTGSSTAAGAATNLGVGTTDSPVFVTTKLSGLTDDYIPYHVDDATGFANGPTKTNVDDAVSKKHSQNTDTGTSNNFTVADGKYLATDKVRAYDGAGLYLVDDGDNGIFVEDGGNVGIGTASPGAKLEINATAANTPILLLLSSEPGGDGYFEKIGYSTRSMDNTGVFWNAWGAHFNGNSNAWVRDYNSLPLIAYGHTTTGDFFIKTDPTTDGSGPNWQMRFFVKEDGNVGIGTTTPNQKLTVESSMSLKEIADATADTAAYGQIWVHDTAPNELWFTDDAGTDTQISPHPLDAPPELYAYGPGIDCIYKRVQPYLGVIFWQTLNGVVTEETFEEYNARRKDVEGHKDKIKEDWDTVQIARLRAEKLKEVIEQEVAISDAFESVEIMKEVQTGTKREGYDYSVDKEGKVVIMEKNTPILEKQGTGKFEKRLKAGISFDAETGTFISKRQLTEAEVNDMNFKAPEMPAWMKTWKENAQRALEGDK